MAASNSNRVLPWATLAMFLGAAFGSCVVDRGGGLAVSTAPADQPAAPAPSAAHPRPTPGGPS